MSLQVGFYTYGNGAHAQWSLKQAGNFQQARQQIQSLTLSGGSATAGQAIRQAFREGFSAHNGGRAGVPKIIIHVSSGAAADPTFFHQEVGETLAWGARVGGRGCGGEGRRRLGGGSVVVCGDSL